MDALVKYEWRTTPGWSWKGDAEEIGRHIDSLAENKAGFITTQDIVNDARDAKSPLHSNFEWDDLAAAENWREQTARSLIGSIVTVKVEQSGDAQREIRVRAFVNVVVDDQHYYSPVVRIMQEPALYDQYIKRVLQEAFRLREKVKDFEEFAQVVAAIDQLPVARLMAA
jgi:hypothetical protein